jgi:hypothetical protein
MRKLFRLAVFAGLVLMGKRLFDQWMASSAPVTSGRDTATGTDPKAKWSAPGYEDKSFGQAVNQDQQLVDDLVRETGGDMAAAEARFREESAGAPAIARQEG